MNLLSDYINNDWAKNAICASDSRSEAWMSYNKEDIIYAKIGCEKCTVRRECFLQAWEANSSDKTGFYGVNGGISEYEFLLGTWKEAKKDNDDNWTRTDRILQKFMRQIS